MELYRIWGVELGLAINGEINFSSSVEEASQSEVWLTKNPRDKDEPKLLEKIKKAIEDASSVFVEPIGLLVV